MIQINNVNLADIIMFKLDKIDNEFTQEELNQITEIVIDLSMEDDSVFVILKEVIKLKQLQLITIRNASFENDDFSYLLQLTNLKGIVFENCEFENADLIASLFVQSLSLINCNIANYSFVNVIPKLEELTIISGNIEMEKINAISTLRYLQISYSTVTDLVELNVESIEELYIDHSNLHHLNFLLQLPNLKRLSIDEKQYNNNLDTIEKIKSRNVLVLEDNMVEFGGDHQ